MRYELSETQQLLQKSAREFLTAECPMSEVRRIIDSRSTYDSALWQKMTDQGWTGMIFPEEQDGMALGMVEMTAIFEQMGRVLLPGPFHSTVALAGPMISASGDHKRASAICSGDARATAAIVEETAEWTPSSWQTSAQSTASGWLLNGCKLFVPDAADATFLVCPAKVNGELGLFAVDRANAAIQDLKAMDLTRPLFQVAFNQAPAELLARGAAAEAALQNGLDVANVALVAEMVGGMQKVLEISVAYAKTRKQFDKPIGQFQAVQHMCADMLLWTESSRAAVYYAAYALQEKLPEASSAISVAKVYAGEAYREVGNRGIQIHGGMGFTWENDIHLYYRRAKACESALGDTAFHRERIAQLVIDRM